MFHEKKMTKWIFTMKFTYLISLDAHPVQKEKSAIVFKIMTICRYRSERGNKALILQAIAGMSFYIHE